MGEIREIRRMVGDEKRESEMADGDGGASVWRGFQDCASTSEETGFSRRR